MITGNQTPSAAPPPGDFARALSAFHQAQSVFTEARKKLDLAQAEQAAAINGLPESDRADMAQLEAIADRLKLNELGTASLALMTEGDAALEALVAIPAPTMLALHQKMHSIHHAGWETADYFDRLLSDSGTLGLQFGHVWLDRWTAKGAYVVMTGDTANIGWPVYDLSPVHAEDEARMAAGGLPEEHRQDQRSWYRWFYDGKIRELYDVLREVPGGVDAVKAIVGESPRLGLPAGVTTAAGLPGWQAWNATRQAYRDAVARVEAETDEARVDALVDELFGKYWDDLMGSAAPSIGAVIEKLELIRSRYSDDGFGTPDAATDAVIADLRRLGGEVLA
jgi:hypothetical protein